MLQGSISLLKFFIFHILKTKGWLPYNRVKEQLGKRIGWEKWKKILKGYLFNIAFLGYSEDKSIMFLLGNLTVMLRFSL